ncbi:MAG: nucleotidyl transferase AbiEii/AbiGii toxin family protein [Nanoarchaeota archaeon]
MDEIKRITENEFNDIASKYAFNRKLLTKDYFVTLLLYLIKDVKGIYFKGGTALQKVFLHHTRLSEDIDFSITRDIKEIKKEIIEIIMQTSLFEKITEDKNTEGFLRLVIHYKGFTNEHDEVFIDLNKRAKLMRTPESHQVHQFYEPFIPNFSIKTLAREELIAEKVEATMQRNKPRDHFDVYQIIRANMPINLDLVKEKCVAAKIEFSIMNMFNKAKTLKNRWDDDMTSLLAEPVSFKIVMQFLSDYFKLKEEKLKK